MKGGFGPENSFRDLQKGWRTRIVTARPGTNAAAQLSLAGLKIQESRTMVMPFLEILAWLGM